MCLQQGERIFLLPSAFSREASSLANLGKVLMTGFRADLIVATIGVLVSVGVWVLLWVFLKVSRGIWHLSPSSRPFARGLGRTLLGFGVFLLIFLTLDMGYYNHSHHHMDMVFFEYVDDMFVSNSGQMNQALQQTRAELQEGKHWALRLAWFLMLEGAIIGMWIVLFRWYVAPMFTRFEGSHSSVANVLLGVGLVIGLTGFHPYSMWAIRSVPISSTVYYGLAQNPVWYAGEVLLSSFLFPVSGNFSRLKDLMTLEEAIQTTQTFRGSDGMYSYPEFPLVWEPLSSTNALLGIRTNVLLIFVEGLDRRYLGRILDPKEQADWYFFKVPGHRRDFQSTEKVKDGSILLTPFLDRLRKESLYFEHFFSNGRSTMRGLFATLCSFYPRMGWDVIRTGYGKDFLCLPSVLKKAGYRTEMVIAQSRGSNREQIGLFMARNGLDQLFDVKDFPSDTPRLGIGISDGRLFDFLRSRIKELRKTDQPYFLSTLTVGTHAPYEVPTNHPDIRALESYQDRYIPALRYFDLELERFFRELQDEGLLQDTLVFILGDHGRHEWRPVKKGGENAHDWVGHFLSPLFIWVDPSLHKDGTFRPRVVTQVMSQVDLAPTILGLNGLMPRVVPFVGRDLSCLLVKDCRQHNVAIISSGAHLGMAEKGRVLGFAIQNQTFFVSDLDLQNPDFSKTLADPTVSKRYHTMMALYLSSQLLLEQNRVWSWEKFGDKL